MAVAPPPLPDAHRFLIIAGELVASNELTPAEITAVRLAETAKNVHCPICRGPMRITITETGPVGVHAHTPENPYAGHEPEDTHARQSKQMLAQRVQEMFPEGSVQIDAHLPAINHVADIALVNPMGGKLAIEHQGADLTRVEVAARRDDYQKEGIRCLWVLDSRRLKLTKKGGQIRKAMLGELETSFLALDEPLVYLEAHDHHLTWLRPHPDAVELAKLGEKRLGRVECLLRRYRFAQLRIRDGQWWVDRSLDSPVLQQPGALPVALQKKLAKLRP